MVFQEVLRNELVRMLKGFRDNELTLIDYNITFEELHFMLYPPDMREHFLIVAKNARPRPESFTWDAGDGLGGQCVVTLNDLPCSSGYPMPIVPRNGWGCANDGVAAAGKAKVEDVFNKVRAITMAWDDAIDDFETLRRTVESVQDMHSFMASIYPMLESIAISPYVSNDVASMASSAMSRLKNEWRMPKHNPFVFEQSKRFKESDTTISMGMVLPKAKAQRRPVTITYRS